MEFTIASKSKKIAVECSSREPRLRRLKTTLITPLDIHKTNVHKLTDNNPITIAFRNTVKTPYHALNTHDNLPTLATNPLEQVKTYKTEFNTFNMNRNMAKEYEEYVEYEVYGEFGAKRHITSKFEEDCKLQEVQCPSLRGGCNQKEFQAFIQQWSL